MKVRKYHIILLCVSALFMLAHNILPHQHDGDNRGRRYSVAEKQGDLFGLVIRALTSDLGESHLQYAEYEESGTELEILFTPDEYDLPIVEEPCMPAVGSAYLTSKDVLTKNRWQARTCRPLRAPPAS